MARVHGERRTAVLPRALRAAIGFGGLALAGAGTVAHALSLAYPEGAQASVFAAGAILGLVLEFRVAREP
ncbi:hypothetical protein [Salinarimonas chemoclinalis]|uniref:hypothetical protein n=1 Tax=Salinarimonas chemoclinalis TaxID=3241599 RepID=UPI0035587036